MKSKRKENRTAGEFQLSDRSSEIQNHKPLKTRLVKNVNELSFGEEDNFELILNYYPQVEIRKWMDNAFNDYYITPNKIRIHYAGPGCSNSSRRDYVNQGFKLVFKNHEDMTLFLIKFGDEHL